MVDRKQEELWDHNGPCSKADDHRYDKTIPPSGAKSSEPFDYAAFWEEREDEQRLQHPAWRDDQSSLTATSLAPTSPGGTRSPQYSPNLPTSATPSSAGPSDGRPQRSPFTPTINGDEGAEESGAESESEDPGESSVYPTTATAVSTPVTSNRESTL